MNEKKIIFKSTLKSFYKRLKKNKQIKINPRINYTIKNYNNDDLIAIGTTESERDLGILVASNLKYNDQVSKATAKANS